jgi:DNA invertase Pin-like site-specific DNA recombinase
MQQGAVALVRVSTTKGAREGESWETQEKICRSVAASRNLRMLAVFKEPFSARKKQRPILEELFQYLAVHRGAVHYVIVRFIDRFTRAGTEEYEKLKRALREDYGVELVDTTGIIQPTQNTLAHLGVEYDWSRYSPSEISEAVVAVTSKTEVTTILTRMIGREIELVRDGYQIGPANDGYVNKRVFVDGKKKVIQEADPERARFFVAMLTLRASGAYSDKEIVAQLNAEGYLGKPQHRWDKREQRIIGTIPGKPLTVKHLQEIIRRPIYAGVICERWTNYQPVRAKFPGLVAIETFNAANRGKVFIKEHEDGTLQQVNDLVMKICRDIPRVNLVSY